MKKCVFCAEEIKDEAIKCKHCGSDVTGKLFKDDGKGVAQGIKKVELDTMQYNVAIFFIVVGSAIAGSMLGHALHNALIGFAMFAVLFLGFGVVAYRSFLKK